MNIKKITKYLSPALLLTPLVAFAQNSQVQSGLGSVSSLFGGSGLARQTTVGGLLTEIIRTMLLLAGIISVMFIIVGGYWYITSAGNEEQAEKGKGTLVNAIIGIVVIVLSYVIVTVVSNFAAGRPA